MAPTLPTPEDLANWLLHREAGPNPTPDRLAAAAERLYQQLRAGLGVYLGSTGFDTLWSRAMYLAHAAAPPDAAAPLGTLPPGVPAVVLARDTDAAREVLITTFAGVFALLFALLGAKLGLRLLRHVWTALPVSAPDPQTGEITE